MTRLTPRSVPSTLGQRSRRVEHDGGAAIVREARVAAELQRVAEALLRVQQQRAAGERCVGGVPARLVQPPAGREVAGQQTAERVGTAGDAVIRVVPAGQREIGERPRVVAELLARDRAGAELLCGAAGLGGGRRVARERVVVTAEQLLRDRAIAQHFGMRTARGEPPVHVKRSVWQGRVERYGSFRATGARARITPVNDANACRGAQQSGQSGAYGRCVAKATNHFGRRMPRPRVIA
ncbi:hypothetical protein [Burkholderia vietnamiensis]|uniref:hypothetical protein n=1 Tax=Burkholderia vietnamiensis TaxID=60552 RepID=UPI001E56AA7C|nr:hypothetical protein [Burkholderia vietnamiensis]